VSGRSPDLRIIESETAFPGIPQWQLRCFGSPRLQWLGRAGFAPASQIQKTRRDAYTANGMDSSTGGARESREFAIRLLREGQIRNVTTSTQGRRAMSYLRQNEIKAENPT
jgi:hypothetical protein